MQKKYIIIGIIFILLLSIGGSIAYFLNEYKKVTITINYPNVSATLSEYSNDEPKTDQIITTIHSSLSLWLKKSTYQIRFINDELSDSPINITVDDKTTIINVDPEFSTEELSKRLNSEKQTIDATIKSSTTSSFSPIIGDERLYHQGEWGTATLKIYKSSSSDPDISNPDNADTYYIVLKKTNSTWNIVAGPSLIITKPDNPSIPPYIINAINPAQLTL